MRLTSNINFTLNRYIYIGFLLLTGFLSGCSTVKTDKEWQQVVNCTTINKDLLWIQNDCDSEKVCSLIEKELEDPLSEDSAVKIAMMNNQELQVSFEEIGIGKSDLVQAGLFKNPSLSMLFRFPFHGAGTMFDGDMLFPISELWQLPLRKRMAEESLNRILLHVADKVLMTKRDVKWAYNQAVFQKLIAELNKELVAEIKDLAEEAKKRLEWGYIKENEIYTVELKYHDAVIMTDEQLMMQKTAKEHLGKLLSIKTNTFSLNDPDLAIETFDIEVEQAVKVAYCNRLDLRAAQFKVFEKEKMLDLSKMRVLKEVHIGGTLEREFDGKKSLGPVFDVELPIFDQNQAQIAKAEYEVRKAQKELYALEDLIRMEIANDISRIKHLSTKKNLLKEKMLPLQEQIVAFVSEWTDNMQINRFQLIEAKKDLIELKIKHIDTVMKLREELINLEYHTGEGIKINAST